MIGFQITFAGRSVQLGRVARYACTALTAASLKLSFGDAIYREAVTHWAENIGNTTIRLELVELKN